MNWKKVVLGDLITISKGKKHSETNDETHHRYLQIEDLNGHFTKKFTNERGTYVNEKDIIIVWDGANAGKVGCGFTGVIGSTLARLSFKKDDVETRFVKRYLDYKFEYIKSKRTGATIPHVSTAALKSLEVPLPSFEIQQKIAAILDQADALRQKDQQLLKKYNELLDSVFYQKFGDPIKNDKNWNKLNGAAYSKKISVGVVIQPASYYVDNGVIALRSLNIKPNKIILDNLVYFSEDAHTNVLSKSIIREGDVVIVRTGATGTAAVVPKELDNCNCIDLILVRPDLEVIHPIYLSCFFNSQWGKALVLGQEVGGIQKHFNIGAIKSLGIPVPPIQLQNEFASIVKNLQDQIELVKMQATKSETLFQSLLQKAFKGELFK